MTTTITPSVFSSLAGVIRSHSRTHVAGVLDGYIEDIAPVEQEQENTPVVVAENAGIATEEIPTSESTETVEPDAPQVPDEPTTPVEDVAITTDPVHDDDLDTETTPETSTEGDGLTWSAVPAAIEDTETVDDDLDIDVSSYLPGGGPTRPTTTPEVSHDASPEPVSASIISEDSHPSSDSSVPAPAVPSVDDDDDGLDLGDFNPMKYLSGGSGAPVSEPVANSEPASETDAVPVEDSAITPRDPISLLRELANLSR